MRAAEGPRAPADGLSRLRRAHRHGAPPRGNGLVPALRHAEPQPGDALRRLRQSRGPADEVLRGGVPGAGDDLLGAPEGHLPAVRLRQGPRHGCEDHAGRQGRGGLLWRHPAHDRARHVRHQRHGARHRVAAPPFAGRLLHEGIRARVPRQDHPLPRLLGGVRVRPEGDPLRADRPEAEVPGHDLPAGARARDRRGDPPGVLRGRT